MKKLQSKLKISLSVAVFVLALFLVLPFKVKAAAVTTTNGNFQLTSENPLFSVTNAAPGGNYPADFTVKNIGSDTENLRMKLAIMADPMTLQDYLLLQIKNKDTDVCLLGCGPMLKISDANGMEINFNNIGPGETKNYAFILIFDSSADNRFQNANMTFDLTLGYEGSAPSSTQLSSSHNSSSDGGGGGSGGRTTNPIARFLGLATGSATAGAETNNGEQPTIEGQSGQTSEVAGVTTNCQSWPKWVWILALVIFALNFWRNARKNYREEKYSWIVPLVWTIAAVLFWYFFDKCRIYQWFLYCSIIIAIASHFIYLSYLRRKIGKVEVKKDVE